MDPRDNYYLGDGVYVSVEWSQVRLCSVRDGGIEHFVYLDPETLRNFETYILRLRKYWATGK